MCLCSWYGVIVRVVVRAKVFGAVLIVEEVVVVVVAEIVMRESCRKMRVAICCSAPGQGLKNVMVSGGVWTLYQRLLNGLVRGIWGA